MQERKQHGDFMIQPLYMPIVPNNSLYFLNEQPLFEVEHKYSSNIGFR